MPKNQPTTAKRARAAARQGAKYTEALREEQAARPADPRVLDAVRPLTAGDLGEAPRAALRFCPYTSEPFGCATARGRPGTSARCPPGTRETTRSLSAATTDLHSTAGETPPSGRPGGGVVMFRSPAG